MSMMDPIVAELDQEAATTRKVLAAVPTDKLGWKPHPKSMSLGELAMHLANMPGFVAKAVVPSEFDFGTETDSPPPPATAAEIVAAFEQGMTAARATLGGISDADASATWTLKMNGKTLVSFPRIAFVRVILLNHSYHHRGQLSVYLRLLDVPVPSIYGPSADENPWG
jgi:uncharacterized damage-inducible protein DinB